MRSVRCSRIGLRLRVGFFLLALGGASFGAWGRAQTPPAVRLGSPSPGEAAVLGPAQAGTPSELKPVVTVQEPKKSPENTEQLPPSIQLEPPRPERFFQLSSEAALRKRLRQEDPTDLSTGYGFLPEDKAIQEAPRPRSSAPDYTMEVAAHYVCCKRLFFEQPRPERYGHSLSVIEPVVDATVFGLDLCLLVPRFLAAPCRRFDCYSDGYSRYFTPGPCRGSLGVELLAGWGLDNLGLWE